MRNPVIYCEWFALCTNAATHTVSHPILGSVPTCERCVKKLNLANAQPIVYNTNK